MPKLNKESTILVGTKEQKIGDLIKTLPFLPAEQVVNFFQEIGLTIPRELRIYVFKETLRMRVAETRRSRGTLADELNYRLSWFAEFSETQLENLLIFFDDEALIRQFLDDFWIDLLGYMVDKQVPANDLKKLVDASVKYVKGKGLVLPDIKNYNRTLSVLFYDSFNRIDGLSLQKIRPVLYKSSTLNEIRDLGSKYGVNVPRRLKKNELADIIINELKDKGEYTPALEAQVRSMSVLVLQRFAIDHDIKASTELKKEEIIEYILKNAKETREAYFVPSSIAAYDQEIENISDEEQQKASMDAAVKTEEQEVEEEAEPEEDHFENVEEINPQIEEDIEPIQEKVQEPEPQPQPQQETVQPKHILEDALVAEVKALRETIETLVKKPEIEAVKDKLKEDQPIVAENAGAQDEATHVYPEKGVPIMLNAAEFSGDSKTFKKIVKSEIKEREAFVKQTRTEDENLSDDTPRELKVLGRLGIRLLKMLKFLLLKVVLPILIVALILFIGYGFLDFYTTVTFTQGISDAINGFMIGGTGILEHFFNFLESLGLTQAV